MVVVAAVVAVVAVVVVPSDVISRDLIPLSPHLHPGATVAMRLAPRCRGAVGVTLRGGAKRSGGHGNGDTVAAAPL